MNHYALCVHRPGAMRAEPAVPLQPKQGDIRETPDVCKQSIFMHHADAKTGAAHNLWSLISEFLRETVSDLAAVEHDQDSDDSAKR